MEELCPGACVLKLLTTDHEEEQLNCMALFCHKKRLSVKNAGSESM